MSIQKTITPIDNSVYIERPLSTQTEIDNVIENSKKSFQSWKNTSIENNKRFSEETTGALVVN